jgi:uncharacterized Zn finger protein (UPF0148 family)
MEIKKSNELCPYCGVQLYYNARGDLVCPNHGIVKFNYTEKKKDE